jgi:hypothetical protein
MNASLKIEDPPSALALKDSVVERYISHYYGEIKNSLFFGTATNKENKLIYPAANTIVLNNLSASF